MPKRSVGTKLLIGLNAVAGLTSIGGISKSADTLDTTTLDSDGGYRTFTGGFKDGGEVPISGYFEPGDSGQLAMEAAFESGNELPFQIVFPAELGASWSFRGVVTAISTNAELEELVGYEATIKVSGKPSLVTQPSSGLTALSLTAAGGALSPAFANGVYYYSFAGVTANSATLTATAANHELKLYINNSYSQDLVSGQASSAIPLTAGSKKLTIVATGDGKAPATYEVVVIKT